MANNVDDVKVSEEQVSRMKDYLTDGDKNINADKMNDMLKRLTELKKKLEDGSLDPAEALKLLKGGQRGRDQHVPTSYEYILFLVVVTIIILVFGKEIKQKRNTTLKFYPRLIRNGKVYNLMK